MHIQCSPSRTGSLRLPRCIVAAPWFLDLVKMAIILTGLKPNELHIQCLDRAAVLLLMISGAFSLHYVFQQSENR